MYGLLASGTSSLITESLKTAFSSAVSNVLADVGSMMALALPAALTITGGFLAIRLGIKFFKSVSN